MIRVSAENPFFGLWRDRTLLAELADPAYLTTARYEPTTFRKFGSGHIDLLFERGDRSCILGTLRLLPNNLILREQSPLVWPAVLAGSVDHGQLKAIEEAIIPWLRSLVRGRVAASESIRRFVPSDRFERARAAGLVGAAPLERAVLRMAPFVYARRFARGAHVRLACTDAALGAAVLGDLARRIDVPEPGRDDEAFACAWYGVGPSSETAGTPDIVIADRCATFAAQVVIETTAAGDSATEVIDVPTPAPFDLLFAFDAADAPPLARFGVLARERPVRDHPQFVPASAPGTSTGTIVLAVGAEALAMRGDDIGELLAIQRCLETEGFRVHLVTQTADPALAQADLIHIFGDATDVHMLEFAERAGQRGIPYIIDLPPQPIEPSSVAETTLYAMFRSAFDEHDLGRFLGAYEQGKLEVPREPSSEPAPEEWARRAHRFGELARRAVAIFTPLEDTGRRAASLPPDVAARLRTRGVFLEPEPTSRRIEHLVPMGPFALVHAPIARRSFSLFPAYAAERGMVPTVIAGPVYDVDYLHVLRAIAPNAIVLADPDAAVVSALFRQAAIVVEVAPRPSSTGGIIRGIACGALPVVATESPLARLTGDEAPLFSQRSVDECARTMAQALSSADRPGRVARLQARLLPRCDPASARASILAAYAGARPSSVDQRLLKI